VHEVRGYNLVAQHARGDLLVFSQDDRLPPRDPLWVELVVHFFRLLPDHFAALSLHRGNAHVVRARWETDHGACLDLNNNVVPTAPHPSPLAYVASVKLGPLVVRRAIFATHPFNESYSPVGLPGIKFDQEYAARLWAHGLQVGVVCTSKATLFLNGCGGQKTSVTKARRRIRWRQAERNTALLSSTYDLYREQGLVERVRLAQHRLSQNTWLSAQLSRLLPGCVNCTAEPARARRIWSQHDFRICWEQSSREQGAGSREQRQQGAEQGARSREQGAEQG